MHAFETIIYPYLDDLRRFCHYLTKSSWDGEDLYQETLLKSFVYYHRNGIIRDSKPFLFRVAKNLWIDQCRLRRRRNSITLSTHVSYEDADYVEIRGIIEWLAERMSKRLIELWLLAEYFHYSMQEISDLTGQSIPAIKSVLHRARRIIREQDRMVRARALEIPVIHIEVERWVRAIIREQPQGIYSACQDKT